MTDLVGACLATSIEPPAILVSGIRVDIAFDPAKVKANRDAIAALLEQLPEEFLKGRGGGWTFLNLCLDRHGRQWTGLHQVQEQLCCLAVAAGLGRWLMDRALWAALPGGMPYVQFDVEPATTGASS